MLWARAESVEALNSSFTEIARLLNLPEKDEQEQAITILAVKRWLQRQHGWLLILDNADSPALLPDFLPPTVGGHLLITTRAAEVSTYLAGLTHPLVVDTFSDEQGALFLLHRSNLLALDATLDQAEPPVQQLALSIARDLGSLPLALDQAGAYLKATGCGLSAYQELYQRHRVQLLTERRGADHPEPVATTWNISFRQVEQQSSAAADLLRLCAFLAPDTIPEAVLTKGAGALGPVLALLAADAHRLNEAVESLRAYSLIARDPQNQTITIHRLVQAVLQDSMPAETQRQWMQRAIQAVAAAYPESPDIADWPALERLLPHALACVAWIEQAQLAMLEVSSLLDQTGCYLRDRARYREAEPLLERALAICEQQLGSLHLNTARSLSNLAELYRNQGKYEQAEPLYRRALAIREQQLGSLHLDAAQSLNDLALLYRVQGK